MLWFWFVLLLALAWGVAGYFLLNISARLWATRQRYPYHHDEGLLTRICAVCAWIFSAVFLFYIAGTAIDRHVSEQSCEKKDRYSSSEYLWVDYHYFSYECMLITPTGNITESPVLPIEDVGRER